MASSADIFFSLRVTAKIYSSEDIVEQPLLNQARDVLHTRLCRKIICFHLNKHQPRIEPVKDAFGRKKGRR